MIRKEEELVKCHTIDVEMIQGRKESDANGVSEAPAKRYQSKNNSVPSANHHSLSHPPHIFFILTIFLTLLD
jgi:hypothetical protein